MTSPKGIAARSLDSQMDSLCALERYIADGFVAVSRAVESALKRVIEELRGYREAGADRFIEARIMGVTDDGRCFERVYDVNTYNDPLISALADMDTFTDGRMVWRSQPTLCLRDVIVTEWTPYTGGDDGGDDG